MSESKYVQFGCGLSAPVEWINFDASPTLRVQQMPLIGSVLSRYLNVKFPQNVIYGDIITGLPAIENNSCTGVYSSHILEHLSLIDLRIALQNTFSILNQGGVFRLVVPDLEFYIDEYSHRKDENAAIQFMQSTLLGTKIRNRGMKGLLKNMFGNSIHLWMWDYQSMKKELEVFGFRKIRRCSYGDAKDKMFLKVENPGRFINSLAIECVK